MRASRPPKLARSVINLAGVVATLISLPSCGPEPIEIVAALSARESETVVGRLGRGVVYRGEGSGDRDQGVPLSVEDRRRYVQAANEVRKIARNLPAPEQDELIGRLSLLSGDHDRAILELETATAYPDPPASALNALAVAYLTRARQEGRAFDLVLALGAVIRAQERDPDSPDIRFNVARILSGFPLRHRAAAAWRKFLEVADEEASVQEAEAWIQRLEAPSHLALWREQEALLETAVLPVDSSWVDRVVESFPFRARLYVEERLLGTWAAAVEGGNSETAARALTVSRAIGEALAVQRGEHLIADAIAVIDRLAAFPGPRRDDLLVGHRLFAEGMTDYYVQRLTTAEEKLVEAGKRLERAESPMAGWARFFGAICLYYRDTDEAVRRFEAQLFALDVERYPSLAGRIHWLLGTAIQNDEPLSLEHYEKAFELLDASSGFAGSSMLHLLIAEAYKLLSDSEQAWQHRLLALDLVGAGGDPRRIHSMLGETIHSLLAQGLGAEAEPFLHEMAYNAESWADHPYAVAEVHHLWAQQAISIEKPGRALEEIEATRAIVERLEKSGLTDWLRSWLSIYEGVAVLERDPDAAYRLISEGFDWLDETGNQVERPRYLAKRAAASLALGDVESAVVDLEDAIDYYENTRVALAPGLERARFFGAVQPAFERLIALQLASGVNGEKAAFETSERARARFMTDLAAPDHEWPAVATLDADRLGSQLTERQALVEYVFLPEGLVAWIMDNRGLRTMRFDIDRDRLARDVELFRHQLQGGSPVQSVLQTSASLFDSIVRPLAIPESKDYWILVPDGALADLPFVALYDRAAQSFLGSEKALSILPSARFIERGQRNVQPGDVILFGNPTGDLEASTREIEGVASIYGGGEALLGTDATRAAFLAYLGRAEVLHFAGHSEANPEQAGRSRLLLADGPVEAHEIWSRDLSHTRLVVLSGCRSAVGDRTGRQALFGLAGGFLSAGAREVVASYWDVDDEIAQEVMIGFHRHYRQSYSAAEASRRTIEELVLNQSSVSIFVWGAFSVFGGSRTTHYTQ